jgi:hypothetical protein
MKVQAQAADPKVAHDGHRGPPIGPTVWVLEHAGTVWGVWPTRHDALRGRAQLANTNCYKEEWFTAVPMPVGAVRLSDIRRREDIDALDTPKNDA